MDIGNGYKLERDRYQWILHLAMVGKDKDGNPKTSWIQSYHATLRQVANSILEHTSESRETVEDLILHFDAAAARIETGIAATKEATWAEQTGDSGNLNMTGDGGNNAG